MYLELTNACNMTCKHCCMNAVSLKSKKAAFMSRLVIEQACLIAHRHGDWITLGGGEPTLHPDFMFAFGMGILHAGELGLLVVTNGTNKDLTLRMLDLSHAAKEGATLFSCEVSKDIFHDVRLVDPVVYEKAQRTRSIRDVSHRVIAKGRGRNLAEHVCCTCETIHVSFDGTVHKCGCKRKRDYLGRLPWDFEKIRDMDINWGECNGRRFEDYA